MSASHPVTCSSGFADPQLQHHGNASCGRWFFKVLFWLSFDAV
jgi:hypothetical protein